MRTYEQYLRNRENRLRNFNQENCTCNGAQSSQTKVAAIHESGSVSTFFHNLFI
ncbi:hypothetical protein [Bacillus xiapuensis]|uniref:Uncharacterized protein n=1 Tax=Bacillus xiapuensis TaxID=2014075 RepID=A0ABU6N6F6_9BACI|nr:hypothetical protein [Bacillus xiapuensis]